MTRDERLQRIVELSQQRSDIDAKLDSLMGVSERPRMGRPPKVQDPPRIETPPAQP
jgi:hypothetical protein